MDLMIVMLMLSIAIHCNKVRQVIYKLLKTTLFLHLIVPLHTFNLEQNYFITPYTFTFTIDPYFYPFPLPIPFYVNTPMIQTPSDDSDLTDCGNWRGKFGQQIPPKMQKRVHMPNFMADFKKRMVESTDYRADKPPGNDGTAQVVTD